MTILAKYWYLCLNLASDIIRNTKTDHLDDIYWLGQARIDVPGGDIMHPTKKLRKSLTGASHTCKLCVTATVTLVLDYHFR